MCASAVIAISLEQTVISVVSMCVSMGNIDRREQRDKRSGKSSGVYG